MTQEKEIAYKLACLVILLFAINGCKSTPKNEANKITNQDIDKELRDRRPLPDFYPQKQNPTEAYIEDKKQKEKNEEPE